MAYALTKFLQRSERMARSLYKFDGYQKYGLYHDDLIGGCYDEHDLRVAEANRRLMIDQPDVYDLRNFRTIRAFQLKIQKKVLPESEWPTFDEDITKGRYLQPYLEQIDKEAKEKRQYINENE